MKVCNRCNEEKELNEFFKDAVSKDGHYSICKTCKEKSVYSWRVQNREKYNAGMRAYSKKHRRRIHYKRHYQITPDQYEEMLNDQGRACAICCKTNGNGKRPFVIDHSHSTGKIRGILCYGCNRALSTLESPVLLQKAMSYLLRY